MLPLPHERPEWYSVEHSFRGPWPSITHGLCSRVMLCRSGNRCPERGVPMVMPHPCRAADGKASHAGLLEAATASKCMSAGLRPRRHRRVAADAGRATRRPGRRWGAAAAGRDPCRAAAGRAGAAAAVYAQMSLQLPGSCPTQRPKAENSRHFGRCYSQQQGQSDMRAGSSVSLHGSKAQPQ